MAGSLRLPLVDLASTDRTAAAGMIRQACLEYGFFYLTNHGIDSEVFWLVFGESKKFFCLSFDEKMQLNHSEYHRGYTPLYAENLDPSTKAKGDLKESFYIGPSSSTNDVNQWPSEESLPIWRSTMVSYYEKVLSVGKKLLALIALALNLDERFFEINGALSSPMGFLRLLHYPGELMEDDFDNYGASAHSDYGMVTLLMTDGVPGLQICREKDKWPRQWEDVPQIYGAFIINVGDMLERWTNCLFRSTLHRVVATGKERYSLAFFLDPSSDCLVECLESCCSEACPPKFPPILSGDYLNERLRLTYSKSSSSGDLPSNASSPSSSTYLFQNQCSLHTVPICSSCSPFVSGNKKKINKVIPITQPAKKKKTPHFKWQRIHIMLCAVRTVNKKSAATAMLFPADLISKGKISLVSSNGSDPHENEYPNTKMTNSAINKRAHASLIIPWSPSSADMTHPTATRELNNRAPPRRNKFRRPNRSTNGMAARFPTVPAVLITRVESNEVLSLRPIVRNNNGA